MKLPTRHVNLVIIGVYLLGAFYVTARLWLDVGDRATASNVEDFAFFEFVFSHAAHSVVNWENPLFNPMLNSPDGVNMMANTSMLAISIPLTPITLLFGAGVSV